MRAPNRVHDTIAEATLAHASTSAVVAKDTTATKRVVMSLGDKGGSSKSFVVRKLSELHLDAHTPGLMLVERDQTVGTLFRFYAGRTSEGRTRSKPRAVCSFSDCMVRSMRVTRSSTTSCDGGADLVVTDLPATSLTKLREICEEYDFAAAVADAGYRLTIVAPITPYDDTILDLQEAVALIDPEAFSAFEKLFDATLLATHQAPLRTHARSRRRAPITLPS